jgi:ABC-type lipoprotein release transport system permease subunit
MNLLNLFKIAWKALLRNKTRAFLTMLGIIIGISSVIAMVSLGQSSSKSINNQISSMGTNLIMVMRTSQRQGGVNIGSSNVQTLTDKDGAKNKDILLQFLCESIILSLIGGIIGILLRFASVVWSVGEVELDLYRQCSCGGNFVFGLCGNR